MAEIIDIREYREQKELDGMTKLEYEARVIYLAGYMDAVNKLRSAEMELEELDWDYGPGVPKLSGASGGRKTGDGSDRIIRRMMRREELLKIISRSESEALRMRMEVEKAIEGVTHGDYRTILRYRYINDMYLEDIADKVNYSVRQVQRHHQRGVMRMRIPKHVLRGIKAELYAEHPEWALMEMKAA